MIPITLFKHTSGNWVANWGGRVHHVRFDPTDEETFISLGLKEHGAVKFEINQRGVILGIYDNNTGESIDELSFPVTHSLYHALNVGRPV